MLTFPLQYPTFLEQLNGIRVSGRDWQLTSLKQATKDKKVYELALDYLRKMDDRVTSEIISRHLSTPPRPDDMQIIFRRLIMSAKNAGMKPNVIGKDKDVDDIKEILCNYNPSEIIRRYHGNPQELLKCIVIEKAQTGRTLVTKPNSIWPSYCQSIIEGASFLNHFNTAQEFHHFVDIYHDNPITVPDLPRLLANQIHGIGFALACDFLKEIGYQNYSKPDVYLKRILPALKLSKCDNDLIVFEAVARIARNAGTTAFAVDKVFWLIGSGNFHLNNLPIKGHGAEFIEYAKSQLTLRRPII
jgi:hypothetical protein